MSAPGRTGGAAAYSPPGRYASLVANTAVAARFLPVWLATGVLIDRRGDHRSRRAAAHELGFRPAVHDDPRDCGARADARDHAGRHRPFDAGRGHARRAPDRRREPGAGRPAGARHARMPRSRRRRGARERHPRRDREAEPADRHAGRRRRSSPPTAFGTRRRTRTRSPSRRRSRRGRPRSLSASASSSGRAPRSPSPSRSCFATRLLAGASRRSAQTREPRGWPACASARTSFSRTRRPERCTRWRRSCSPASASNVDPAFGAAYLLAPIAAVVIAGASLSGGLASATSTWVAALRAHLPDADAGDPGPVDGAPVHRLRRSDHRRNAHLRRPGRSAARPHSCGQPTHPEGNSETGQQPELRLAKGGGRCTYGNRQ